MQAVEFRLSIPKYLLARGIGRRLPELHTNKVFGQVALRDVTDPVLPGPDWLALEPVLAGVCGTDLGTIAGRTSPALAPFSSFPAVLGHEVVARVAVVGEAVEGFAPGERVVVDPWISCTVRGLEPCAPCRAGRPYLCRRAAEGPFGPGMLVGFCRGLPGGWSERMVVHKSQVYKVPEGLSDAQAVLTEPIGVALHGVLKSLDEGGPTGATPAKVLVIGAGPIGLAVVVAIRLLGLPWHVTSLARHAAQRELAFGFGADSVVGSNRDSALRAAEEVTGAKRFLPPIGKGVVTGGFDVVFDCAGTAVSVDDALRVAREGGRVVLLGGAGQLRSVDWTFVWMRELQVIGSVGCGLEPHYGRHTFEVLFSLLERAAGLNGVPPVERMITHRFSLDAYREALQANFDRGRTGAVKTVFEVGSSS